MKTFLEYIVEELTDFDPAQFFQKYVEHGHFGGNVVAEPAAPSKKKGATPKKREVLSRGAVAQLGAAVNVFDQSVRRSGHRLNNQQREQLRKHAYGILASHFDPHSPSRIHQYHIAVNGPTERASRFTTTVGNIDKSEHPDVHLTSSEGHNFSTEVKELSNASLGDFSGRGKPGQVVSHPEQSALTRLYKPTMEPGEGRDIQLNPRAQKTLVRRFEKTTKRKGNSTVTVVEVNDETPWNSRLMHFGVSRGQPRLSDTIKGKHTRTSWVRHQMRGAKQVKSEPGVLSRRFVQSIGNVENFKKAIRQLPQMKTKELFRL
jgi:hypothetical protein